MIDPIKKMDFDLKYDGGILTKEFFMREDVKNKNTQIYFILPHTPEGCALIDWTYNPNNIDNLFPLMLGKLILLDNIGDGNTGRELYCIKKYTGLKENLFTFRVRRANIIERIIYHLKNMFK